MTPFSPRKNTVKVLCVSSQAVILAFLGQCFYSVLVVSRFSQFLVLGSGFGVCSLLSFLCPVLLPIFNYVFQFSVPLFSYHVFYFSVYCFAVVSSFSIYSLV